MQHPCNNIFLLHYMAITLYHTSQKSILPISKILGPLGCPGWVVLPKNLKKCQKMHPTVRPLSCKLYTCSVVLDRGLFLEHWRKWGRKVAFPKSGLSLKFLNNSCMVSTFSPQVKTTAQAQWNLKQTDMCSRLYEKVAQLQWRQERWICRLYFRTLICLEGLILIVIFYFKGALFS